MCSGTGKFRLFITIIFIIITATGLSAQSLSITAELDQQEIWLGDTVNLTLFLKGSEEAIAPELFIRDVRVEALGGTVRSSRSITNINGKVTENVSKAYVYGYNLTPKKAGTYQIPAITIEVEGQQLSTRPVIFDVNMPGTSDDFLLNLEFDRGKVYLNEDCHLRVNFQYAKSLRTLEIMIPGLEGVSYSTIAPSGKNERYEINVNGSPVVFERDDKYGGAGLTADFVLKARKSGTLSLENSTASFESVIGTQRVRDFFGRVQLQEVYGRTVIAGNKTELKVLPFPEDERPVDFFGLSGNIKLGLGIEPAEAYIGDPLTLTLTVAGMNNTEVEIPSLSEFLGNSIDIPDTRSSGKKEGRTKTLTQTVRINDSGIKQIPSIKFSYFDPETESYKYASTAPVPIKILDTRVVTAADLEGENSTGTGEKKVVLEKKRDGIYYNYSGKELLSNDSVMIDVISESILLKIIILFPAVIFMIIWIYTGFLPQVRQKALSRADRKKAEKSLRKWVKKADKTDTKVFLKEFNNELSGFLKKHGTDTDYIKLKPETDSINRILYGGGKNSPEDSIATAEKIVQILSVKEARNA